MPKLFSSSSVGGRPKVSSLLSYPDDDDDSLGRIIIRRGKAARPRVFPSVPSIRKSRAIMYNLRGSRFSFISYISDAAALKFRNSREAQKGLRAGVDRGTMVSWPGPRDVCVCGLVARGLCAAAAERRGEMYSSSGRARDRRCWFGVLTTWLRERALIDSYRGQGRDMGRVDRGLIGLFFAVGGDVLAERFL